MARASNVGTSEADRAGRADCGARLEGAAQGVSASGIAPGLSHAVDGHDGSLGPEGDEVTHRQRVVERVGVEPGDVRTASRSAAAGSSPRPCRRTRVRVSEAVRRSIRTSSGGRYHRVDQRRSRRGPAAGGTRPGRCPASSTTTCRSLAQHVDPLPGVVGVTDHGLVLLDPGELGEVEHHPTAEVGVVGPEPDLDQDRRPPRQGDRCAGAGVQLEVRRARAPVATRPGPPAGGGRRGCTASAAAGTAYSGTTRLGSHTRRASVVSATDASVPGGAEALGGGACSAAAPGPGTTAGEGRQPWSNHAPRPAGHRQRWQVSRREAAAGPEVVVAVAEPVVEPPGHGRCASTCPSVQMPRSRDRLPREVCRDGQSQPRPALVGVDGDAGQDGPAGDVGLADPAGHEATGVVAGADPVLVGVLEGPGVGARVGHVEQGLDLAAGRSRPRGPAGTRPATSGRRLRGIQPLPVVAVGERQVPGDGVQRTARDRDGAEVGRRAGPSASMAPTRRPHVGRRPHDEQAEPPGVGAPGDGHRVAEGVARALQRRRDVVADERAAPGGREAARAWEVMLPQRHSVIPNRACHRRRPLGRPPVPVAEQGHRGRHEQHAHEGRVEQHRHGQADPGLLDDEQLPGDEPGEHDHDEQRGRGDDPARALQPDDDRLVVGVRRARAARRSATAGTPRSPSTARTRRPAPASGSSTRSRPTESKPSRPWRWPFWKTRRRRRGWRRARRR